MKTMIAVWVLFSTPYVNVEREAWIMSSEEECIARKYKETAISDGMESFGCIALLVCRWEDDSNCYWDAKVSGNGQGRSFIDLNGEVIYTQKEENVK